MPIYEYLCRNCGQRTSVLTRSISQQVDPTCEHCGGRDLQRLVSSFGVARSVKDVHEASGPPPRFPNLDYYRDPRNIGRNVEEAFQRFGVEMPDSVRESIAAAREGEVPKEVQL